MTFSEFRKETHCKISDYNKSVFNIGVKAIERGVIAESDLVSKIGGLLDNSFTAEEKELYDGVEAELMNLEKKKPYYKGKVSTATNKKLKDYYEDELNAIKCKIATLEGYLEEI